MITAENSESAAPRADARHPVLQALTPHLPKLLQALAALVLLTEAILATVVIFSRMTAFQQFICLVLIVALPVAALGIGVLFLARLAAPSTKSHAGERRAAPHSVYPGPAESPWNPQVQAGRNESSLSRLEAPRLAPPAEPSPAIDDLAIIVEQLEEMSVRARRLPFNIIGLNDEQFTYVLVKLRATSQALLQAVPEISPAEPATASGILSDSAPIFPIEAIDRIQEEMRGRKKPPKRELLPAVVEPATLQGEPDPPLIESVAEARDRLRRGEAELAIRGLKSLLERESEDAEAAELLGIAYERSGDLDSALEAMRVAVLTDPKRASAHYNYAVLLAKAGRLLDAYRQNEVALRLSPEYPAARDYHEALQARITAGQSNPAQAVVGAVESAAHS